MTGKFSTLGKVADLDIEIPETPAPVTAPLLHAHLVLLVVQPSYAPGFTTIQGNLNSLDLEPRAGVCIPAHGVFCVIVETHQLAMARSGDHTLDVEVVDEIVSLVPSIQCRGSDGVVDVGWQNPIVMEVIVIVGLEKKQ